MPIWAVSFYDHYYDLEPSEKGAIKADTEQEAVEIARRELANNGRFDLVRAIVNDERKLFDGYVEFES